MGDKQNMIVGVDIGTYHVQISTWVGKDPDAETISTQMGVERFEIPLCLFLRLDTQTWYYGDKAREYISSKEGVYVEDLWTGACQHRELVLEQVSYSYEQLLGIFLQKLLHLLSHSGYDKEIRALVLTAEDMDDERILLLKKATACLALDGRKIFYLDYQECFGAYATHGLKELWNHNVYLFYYQDRSLKGYRLYVQQKTLPFVMHMEQMDYGDVEYGREELEYSQAAREEMDKKFCMVLQETFAKKIVSAVYLIGDGFCVDWMKDSLRLVCRNRRVFKGNNLFTKGACYAAAPYVGNEKQVLAYPSEQKLACDVRIVFNEQEHMFEYVAKKGTPWYHAGCQMEVMIKPLEQEEHPTIALELVARPEGKQYVEEPVRTERLELKDFPDRPDAASRIRLTIDFPDSRSARIQAEDLGLGEFYPATGMKWERQFFVRWDEGEADV